MACERARVDAAWDTQVAAAKERGCLVPADVALLDSLRACLATTSASGATETREARRRSAAQAAFDALLSIARGVAPGSAIEGLPHEILIIIFSFLVAPGAEACASNRALLSAYYTCRTFRRAALEIPVVVRTGRLGDLTSFTGGVDGLHLAGRRIKHLYISRSERIDGPDVLGAADSALMVAPRVTFRAPVAWGKAHIAGASPFVVGALRFCREVSFTDCKIAGSLEALGQHCKTLQICKSRIDSLAGLGTIQKVVLKSVSFAKDASLRPLSTCASVTVELSGSPLADIAELDGAGQIDAVSGYTLTRPFVHTKILTVHRWPFPTIVTGCANVTVSNSPALCHLGGLSDCESVVLCGAMRPISFFPVLSASRVVRRALQDPPCRFFTTARSTEATGAIRVVSDTQTDWWREMVVQRVPRGVE